LVAGVAHEVKNPLNFIQGNLEYANQYVTQMFTLLDSYQTTYPEPPAPLQDLLAATDLEFVSQDLRKLLNSMEMGADRIQEIVSSLRNFSRIDGETQELTDVHTGIEGTLLILRARFSANADRPGIELVKQFGDIPPISCYVGQLNQVVMNLIANAIDAIDEDATTRDFEANVATPRQVTIATETLGDDAIRIRVQDNGPGMSPETQQKIFETFFTTKPTGKGTGLGLSISHQIITEKHGGQLVCESERGVGSTFQITLPIVAVTIEDAAGDDDCLTFIDSALLD
jgi:signal transduction histidine kinase